MIQATNCSCSMNSCSDHGESIISAVRKSPGAPPLLRRYCWWWLELDHPAAGPSLTRDCTHETSCSSTGSIVAGAVPLLPLPRMAKVADLLIFCSSSPWIPQSSFPLGEPQSESMLTVEGEVVVVVMVAAAAVPRPGYLFISARSEKLWLRFANADVLEFIIAAAMESDGSSPVDTVGVLTGDEYPDCSC